MLADIKYSLYKPCIWFRKDTSTAANLLKFLKTLKLNLELLLTPDINRMTPNGLGVGVMADTNLRKCIN